MEASATRADLIDAWIDSDGQSQDASDRAIKKAPGPLVALRISAVTGAVVGVVGLVLGR